MKHHTAIFTFTFLLHLSASAAVPLRWTVETSLAQPATFEAYQGETLDFEATLQSYGKPLEAPVQYAFYWQTNGMGNAWWSVPVQSSSSSAGTGTSHSNCMHATWLPAYDVGAKAYNCFIGLSNSIYHAAFQLRLRPSPGAVPNELPLPQKVIDFSQVTVLNPPWPNGSARPLPKYLHEIDFADSYPDDAAWYYAQPQDYGGCSVRRMENLVERNYDWKFDDAAEFVVRMEAGPGRFASVGVANCGTNLTETFVTSGKPSRFYKCLPGHTVDGINEHGVIAVVNVCPAVWVERWRGDPAGDGIHCLGAVRWVLDHATDARMAATNLAARVYVPEGMGNFHYMIVDGNETWIVENGYASMAADDVMTNFLMFYGGEDGGSGFERFSVLLSSGSNITNAWYTNAYRRETNPPWVSDLRDVLAYTNEIFDAWATHTKEHFRSQRIGGQSWWQTVHTSVYDITNRTLRIAVQETDDWYVFTPPVSLDPLKSSVSNLTSAVANLESGKRDVDDLSYVSRAPGGWIPTEVEGHRYDIYYDGYSGWYVDKLTYYPEWGEWYYDDYEWVEGPEDAETLVAHKLWSDEPITFTRQQVEIRDSLVLASQVGSQAEAAARDYIQNNDIVKTKTILRTGRLGEYGTGWGTLNYQFTSDRRWWSMIVPSISASFSSGGYVIYDSQGARYVTDDMRSFSNGSTTFYTYADPIGYVRDHTPVAVFVSSFGTNGSARCSFAEWAVGVTAGPGASSASIRFDNRADTGDMPFLVKAGVDHATGIEYASPEDRALVPPVEFDRVDVFSDLYIGQRTFTNRYVLSNFRFDDGYTTVTNRSASFRFLYDVDAVSVDRTGNVGSTHFTSWCTINLGCTPGNYITTNPDYGRVTTTATQGLFYDKGLRATWKVDVTNGCFFSEIVSTNNVTEGLN